MARIRIRHVAFCAVLIVFLYHMLPGDDALPHLPHTFSSGAPNVGTAQLARYMNDPKHVPRIIANRSSFAWNTVELVKQPELTPKLPSPFTKRPRIQHQFRPDSRRVAAEQERRRQEVLRVTKKAWAGYKEYAWMKDALKPISGNYVDQFSGWAATMVDSLDTLWIMGLREEFYEAVEATATIDFGKSTSYTVNTFETNIRYLGGLLAAYDLSGHDVLKTKAIEVGDLLYAAFNTDNNMPVDMINFARAKEGTVLAVEAGVVSASPGTITLEFTRLSQITGDSKYYAAVSHVMDVFASQQNSTKLPGIFLDTALQNLFFHPMIPEPLDILIAGNLDVLSTGPSLDPESEHLSCFIGGLYALAGRALGNSTYLTAGAQLARGCAYAYHAFPSGVMPERYNMIKCPNPHAPCPWSDEVWRTEREKRPHHRIGVCAVAPHGRRRVARDGVAHVRGRGARHGYRDCECGRRRCGQG
ncbi:glycoside hydrolase family 47 protein [Periconia macrospinosa]|uniref:alpha-1,2-Mannosidase n=1 Tax=Periconia macrospinosa TaxID=97972 RepID=A0A2V1DKR0_9PLEO|nr:glycoside hydrolase family 47 protein [Periconia macrospinosa]